MRKVWESIPLPLSIDKDPSLERRLETYLTQNVKGNVLSVTERNPLPTQDLQFFLDYIQRILPYLDVRFEIIAENGYIMYCRLWENDGRVYMSCSPDHRQWWSYEEVNGEYFLASFTRLACSARESSYEEEIQTYKQRHVELDFEELAIKFNNFERLFPVVRNNDTPEPVLTYSFHGKLGYERISHFYSNYQNYYDKLVKFYAIPVTISNYTLKAKKVHLGFDAHRADREMIFTKGILREESFVQQVYFEAYVVVQFEFCTPPPCVWDAEDCILDTL